MTAYTENKSEPYDVSGSVAAQPDSTLLRLKPFLVQEVIQPSLDKFPYLMKVLLKKQ
jgi:hypothetical protein